MYHYLDREIFTLDPGSRFLILVMRGWMAEMRRRRCPLAAIGPLFLRHRARAGLAHFHMAMMIMKDAALVPLHVAPLNCAVAGEDEALLLQLVATVRPDLGGSVGSALALIVRPQSVYPLHRALSGLAVALRQAGLSPAPAADATISAGPANTGQAQ